MRKEIEIDIMDRGQSRRFRITEMPATKCEAWFLKVIHLVAGTSLPKILKDILAKSDSAKDAEDVENVNMATLSALCEAFASIPLENALPLWDELLNCCVRIDGGIEQQCSLTTIDGYLESPLSILKLKVAAMKLNLSFLSDGGNLQDGISSFLGVK